MREIDRHVGRNIRAHRLIAGLSQSELGDAIGVRFQQVQKYETGQNRISASRLCAIAARLCVPVRAFFEGINLSPDGPKCADAGAETVALLADQQVLELARKAARLNVTQKTAITAMIDSMVETEPS